MYVCMYQTMSRFSKPKRIRMICGKNQNLNSNPSSWGKAKRLRAYGLTNTSTLRLLAANPAVGPARHKAATLLTRKLFAGT